ncbi:hypothetical protein GHK43_16185, partial [Sinorhizobium meliloti]|nr:hypothetical protein [Sinorhizobium meliloti]
PPAGTFSPQAGRRDKRQAPSPVSALYCMFPSIVSDQRTKTCSRSKCYSDLCASDKTRGAVEEDEAVPACSFSP